MKRFNAVTKGNTIGDGSRTALMSWLERYVQVLFPENGIEWWSDRHPEGIKPVGHVGGEGGIVNFACYVRKGNCEGRIIEVLALYRDNTFARLVTAKTFGRASECWLIAGAITDALESIYLFEEIPLIVEMYESVPVRNRWQRPAVLSARLCIARGPTNVEVTIGGETIWTRAFDVLPDVAKLHLDSILTDWRSILSSLQISAVEFDLAEDMASTT